MEEILHKNIFDEQDLLTLSPDYENINLPLRMELRRTSVKDTHHHGGKFKGNNFQRNPVKKKKDSYKINKEIAKIRNSFRNIDLKNRVMLKYVDVYKNKSIKYDSDLLLHDNETEMETETNIYMHEFSENLSNLIVRNETDFKINTKPGKTCAENRNIGKIKIVQPLNRESPICYNVVNEDALRIECKDVNISPKHDTREENRVNIKDSCENIISTPKMNQNIPQSDLQSVLIMMALSSKSDNSVTGDHLYESSANINDHVQKDVSYENNDRSFVTNCLKYEEITNVLSITPLKVDVMNRQKAILKKYVQKWRVYISNKKEKTNNMLQKRQATLNNFFDKLAKKKMTIDQTVEPVDKATLLVKDYSKYQHRYKVQKHIIALQKAKLEEQNRLIEELKYNKIVEASRQSVDAMREEVRKTYYEIDRQLKPKIKCLTNELQIHEIEEPALILHCLKVPQFLQRMEKRAREREEKHAIIRERRRQMEEERIRLKQQAELTKAEMDKEEKMKILKELKEKRKKEKIESIRRKQYVERIRALTVMADLHYEKTLMAKYGLRPFKQLINIKRDYMEKAKMHYTFQLKKNIFLHWMWFTEDMWFERNYKAEDFCRKKTLRKAVMGLKENYHHFVLKKQVAEDYYDMYATQIVFRKLREAVEILKRENEVKWQKVVEYHSSNLLFKTFTCWRTLPALNALKREQEARKARWREKVLQVVPDYTPPDD